MTSKDAVAFIKVLIILITLIIVNFFVLHSTTLKMQKSNKITTSHLGPDACCKWQPTPQQNKEDSVFTLLPEKLQKTTLLIIINTVPSEVNRRNTLRQTWAKQSSWTVAANSSDSISDWSNVTISYFFVMGLDGYSAIDEIVKRESTVHKDILRVNLIETYRSLVNKILLTFEWVTTLDIKPHFIAKADHDVYIKTPELATWLDKTDSSSLSKLYTGFVNKNAPVSREVKSPWYVSKDDYSQDRFIPYCLGPFYVFSWDLFLDVLNASKVNTPFPVEDAYMGLLVQKIGVEPRNTGRDLFNANRGLNNVLLSTPEEKVEIPVGIVLGDSLSSDAINRMHRVYTKIRPTEG